MKTTVQKFTALVAQNVPHFGVVEIKARNADHALDLLKAKALSEITEEAVYNPDWESATCARIVYIRDEPGNVFHPDTPLDHTYRELSAIGDLLKALELCIERLEIRHPNRSEAGAINTARLALLKAKGNAA